MIYTGDCIEVMATLEPDSVDAVAEAVCNYGHAFVMHTGRPVRQCPMFEDHIRLAGAVLGAASLELLRALERAEQ